LTERKETIRVELELEIDGDSLTGRATDGDGTVREFAGWLGLLGAIDVLCEPCNGTSGRAGLPLPGDKR
jgi:hypothetical protein